MEAQREAVKMQSPGWGLGLCRADSENFVHVRPTGSRSITVKRSIPWVRYWLEVILTLMRWYRAYPLSLRHRGTGAQKRGVFVEQMTVRR